MYLIDKENNIIISKMFPLLIIAGSFLNFIYFLNMISKSQGYKIIGSIRFLFYTLDINTTVNHAFPFLRRLVHKIKC